MFGTGWFFQLVGHLVFEKNRPVLTADATNIYTYLSALAFVFQEWKHILSGEPLAETRLGADAGIGIEPVDDPPEQLRKAG